MLLIIYYLILIIIFLNNGVLLNYYSAKVALSFLIVQVEEAQKRLNKWEDKKREPLLAGVTNDS